MPGLWVAGDMPLPPHSAIPETGGAWTPRPCLAQTPKHKEYLDFFPKIGISNDFYWFTLEAATYTGMYYMTKADMQKYRYATNYEGSGDTDQLYCENLDKIKITHSDPAHVHPIEVDHDHTKGKERSSSFVVFFRHRATGGDCGRHRADRLLRHAGCNVEAFFHSLPFGSRCQVGIWQDRQRVLVSSAPALSNALRCFQGFLK